jgi:lactate dehydrogenase-like 2-hydroxyacid dehydrogenase
MTKAPRDRSDIYVLGPVALPSHAEAALSERFTYTRLAAMPDPEQFLAEQGKDIQAAAVGGAAGFPDRLWNRLPALKLIAVHGVGMDRVNLEEARRRGVAVLATPNILADDVADLAMGLWIGLCRMLPAADRHIRSGQWRTGPAFPLGLQVAGQKVGLVGLGSIGAAIARRCAPFSKSIAYTATKQHPGSGHPFFSDVLSLAAWADTLFVAVPGGNATQGMINQSVLEALGPKGLLINIARGSVVDEKALIAALQNGTIAGAGLDVFLGEPDIDPAFLELGNVVLAPHIGSATVQTRKRMAEILADQIGAFFAG